MSTSLPSKAHVFSMDFSEQPPLMSAVYSLNAKAKQAFFGAARRHGILTRGTWNGCAFNAGSLEIGSIGVGTTPDAAKAFGVTEYTVHKFITAWDGSDQKDKFIDVNGKTWTPNPSYLGDDDKVATEALVEMILKAGLFDDNPRLRVTVFEAQELEAIEKFRTELDSGLIVEGLLEVEQMLCLV